MWVSCIFPLQDRGHVHVHVMSYRKETTTIVIFYTCKKCIITAFSSILYMQMYPYYKKSVTIFNFNFEAEIPCVAMWYAWRNPFTVVEQLSG